MRLKIQKEKLEKAIRDFYRATGIKLAILDTDFTSICTLVDVENDFCKIVKKNSGNNRCYYSDQKILAECSRTHKPQMHVCHAGLVDIALPIMHGDSIMGYIIMGQMRQDIPFSAIEEKLEWFCKDKCDLKAAYSRMVIYNDERVESLAALAVMLASYVMTEDMINADRSILSDKFTSYVRLHINEELSVDSICKGIGTSRNTLYRHIRNHFGMSVNDYVLSERVALAKRLLRDSDDSISVVCEKSGISNPSYFCKLFKTKTGMSPLKYRREKETVTK